MSRTFASNRRVNKGDRPSRGSKNLNADRIDELLEALVTVGLVIKQGELYKLASGINDKKIAKLLDEVNAKMAMLRQSETQTKAHRLPMHRPLR